MVNLARKAGVAPDVALDRANRKFTERFRGVERLAAERGLDLHSAGLAKLDELWDEVKGLRTEGAKGTVDGSAAETRSTP